MHVVENRVKANHLFQFKMSIVYDGLRKLRYLVLVGYRFKSSTESCKTNGLEDLYSIYDIME